MFTVQLCVCCACTQSAGVGVGAGVGMKWNISAVTIYQGFADGFSQMGCVRWVRRMGGW